jgi:murein DD-endopeptidase MepM/ murein hydrolase activator NlpD
MIRILVVGWLAGGTLIVLLALGTGAIAMPKVRAVKPQAAAAPMSTTVASAVQPASLGAPRSLIIPVAGIGASGLQDTFTQARSGGRSHNAIDILAPRGTPVLAAVDGKVRKLLTSNAGGLTIYQFDVEEQRVYYYAHLDHYAAIREGDFVRQGTVIGYVGTTGNARSTPHLHFAIEVLPLTKEWWKGAALNPYPLLMQSVSRTGVSSSRSARVELSDRE